MKKIFVLLAAVLIMIISACSSGGGHSDPKSAPLSSAKAITAFSFKYPAAVGTITESIHSIAVTVPSGTNVTALIPTITHTGASINPAIGVAQDFTSPVTYTVTATDATTQHYTVTLIVSSPSDHTQYVIIKADDFNGYEDIWISFVNYILEKDIKASIGIICKSLENLDQEYLDLINKILAKSNFELFFHGYDHGAMKSCDDQSLNCREFYGTPYEYQKEHFIKSFQLAKDKLNITFHTFGAPYNKWDTNTSKVVEEMDDINVWFFGDENSPKNISINCNAYVETTTGKVNYNYFFQNYNRKKDLLVMQVHPRDWTEEDFQEFKKIIDYLIREGATFIRPVDYTISKIE